MNLYKKHILPKVAPFVCSLKPATKQREKIVPLAIGRMLELAIGSGINPGFYDSSIVERVWGLGSFDEILEVAKKRKNKHVPVKFKKASVDKIPIDSYSMDSVVITYSLRATSEAQSLLTEIKRALKPVGQLLFCEHGLVPDKSVIQTQNFINSVWSKLGGVCNLTEIFPRSLLKVAIKTSTRIRCIFPDGNRRVSIFCAQLKSNK